MINFEIIQVRNNTLQVVALLGVNLHLQASLSLEFSVVMV